MNSFSYQVMVILSSYGYIIVTVFGSFDSLRLFLSFNRFQLTGFMCYLFCVCLYV